MSSILSTLEDTGIWLAKKGIEATAEHNPPADGDGIKDFQDKTGLTLQASAAEFFGGEANGCLFGWSTGEGTWGALKIDPLEELADRYLTWKAMVNDFVDDPTSMDRCIEHPLHRTQAFQIWRRMALWIPLQVDPEGDAFCLDTTTGAVVLNEHDWFDGFGSLAQTNGILAGASIQDFVRNWSRFCFMPTKGYWWGVFRKHGRITWDEKEFDPAYVRPL